MSVNRRAVLMAGVEAEVVMTEAKKTYKRFNAETGEPYDLVSDGTDLEVKIGDHSWKLPDQKVPFEERPRNGWGGSHESWTHDSRIMRVDEWLESYGIEKIGYKPVPTDLCYADNGRAWNPIIGVTVAATEWDKFMREAPILPDMEEARNVAMEKLSKAFGHSFNIKFFVIQDVSG